MRRGHEWESGETETHVSTGQRRKNQRESKRLARKRAARKHAEQKYMQGYQWRKLDNTAKIFPVIANSNMSNVFRISAVLKETVIPDLLQRALTDVLPWFAGFRVKLHKGFFWYYFETNRRTPVIEKETTYPCKYIDPHGNQLFLFRVSYYGRKINLEVFHALTDGLGAANFLRELVCRYQQILKDQKSEQPQKLKPGAPELKDVEDSYLKYYRKVKRKNYPASAAFRIPGRSYRLDEENIIHGHVSLASLKKAAKGYGVSITKFLTAGLLWCIYEEYLREAPGRGAKPNRIGINLPINLRALFDSETMANFFAVTTIDYQADERAEVTFSQVLNCVSCQMDEKISKEKLEETIAYNVSSEKKWYVRIVPLGLKWLMLNLIFLYKDRAYTMTLSNIGPIHVPPEYTQMIDHFHLMIGVNKRQPFKCSVCAFEDKAVITFASVYEDDRLQTRFFDWLLRHQVQARLEGNGMIPSIPSNGLYPVIKYDVSQWKRLVNLFYILCAAVAAVMVAVNLMVSPGQLWSLIAVAGIAYAGVTVRYSIMRHSNLGAKILIQTIGTQVLLGWIDYRTGYRGWSMDYAVPSIILFSDLSIIFLILVNRLNWQSYLMYQITVTVFSFIPLLLWAMGWIRNPVMAIITVILTVFLLLMTIFLGDRSVKNELIRRFHL